MLADLLAPYTVNAVPSAPKTSERVLAVWDNRAANTLDLAA